MSTRFIEVLGARENNLCDVSLRIPKQKLTVFTGVSGSGKSSLVFDTVAQESQRMINETYPAFLQGFMDNLSRPDVDELRGLTAAIAVDQARLGANPRSTVGTVTDVLALLRVLFARAGTPAPASAQALSFNTPSVQASGEIAVKGKRQTREFQVTGGMCPTCEGLGTVSDLDLDELFDANASIHDGAIKAPGYNAGGWNVRLFAGTEFFPGDVPIKDFSEEQRRAFLYAEPTKVKVEGINMTFEGLVPRIKKSVLSKDREGMQKHVREFVDRVVTFQPCPDCDGTRLSPQAREIKIEGVDLGEVCRMPIVEAAAWVDALRLRGFEALVASISKQLNNMVEIGLGYVALERSAGSLSGGEAQRVKMVKHLGSALTDVTYVFDEPSTGLHPHDIHNLNRLLQRLRDKGNTVLVVEHKPQVIEVADHVIDLGPGAGGQGGQVVFEGSVADLQQSESATGQYLQRPAVLKKEVCKAQGELRVEDMRKNNLRGISVGIPTGVLTTITGVAGSGKSSMVQCFLKAHPDIAYIDQQGIRGSRRSNPATYTGVLDAIRKLFAKEHGVKPGLFSPNSEGACPECKGAGVTYIELPMTPPVEQPCAVCEGRRFQPEVLELTYNGSNIADVLDMSAADAREFFTQASIKKVLTSLVDVGLPYITLGQPLNTLSGGELQRLKLASQMVAKKSEAAEVLILDEPSTGLHLKDVDQLLALLDQLVDQGKTVVCVEHSVAVMAHSDWIIDLGPGAGSEGGRVVVEGTPARVVEKQKGVTAKYLAAGIAT
ncbi:ATP-binding cassette domain-containing protein [Corynebacterium gerontici]|nr:excinuclease ABC subunit UvrA [Corynebacterium gerontici]